MPEITARLSTALALTLTSLMLFGSALAASPIQQDDEAALLRAASEGSVDTVRLLLDQGVDPDVRGEGGRTALMLAAEGGHAEIVVALLEGGADVNAQNNDGLTAPMAAVEGGHVDVVRAFVMYFESAKNRAYQAAMKSNLRNLVVAQESYFADNFTYASLEALGDMFRPVTGIMIEINAVSGTGWSATARHENSMQVCHIFMGNAEPPIEGMQEGERVCQ